MYTTEHEQAELLLQPPAPLALPCPSNSGHSCPPWRTLTKVIFLRGQPKRMHTTSLLLSPPSILSETNSNLWILWDFIFQLNSDFTSYTPLYKHGCTSLTSSDVNFTLKPIPSHHPSSTMMPVPLTVTTPVPKSSLQIKPRASRETPRT
jgi:hypothetical protein